MDRQTDRQTKDGIKMTKDEQTDRQIDKRWNKNDKRWMASNVIKTMDVSSFLRSK